MQITYTKGDTIIREKATEALIHACRPDGTMTLSDAIAAVMKVEAVTRGSATVEIDTRTGMTRTKESENDEHKNL